MGRAYQARCGIVLASHPPQFLAFGEGHFLPAMTAGNGAFDLDLSGHFPNVTTIGQRGPQERQGRQPPPLLPARSFPPAQRSVSPERQPVQFPRPAWLETALFTAMAVNPHSP